MFTGIILCTGVVKSAPALGQSGELVVHLGNDLDLSGFYNVKLGDSIAVDGVCLTVTELNNNNGFSADVSDETIAKTTFKQLKINQIVNLEPALKFGDSLGGHLVQGHVDTFVMVSEIINLNHNKIISFEFNHLNDDYLKYIAPKGSIVINGVSLTVNTVVQNKFTVNLIPYTLSKTNLQDLTVGSLVNLEVDMFARYSVNYLENYAHNNLKEKKEVF